jgi:hypothetical protein
MHKDFINVIENYNFLNPIHTTYDHFMISYIDPAMINSSMISDNYNNMYNTININTKDIMLEEHYFNDNYIKYEFESKLLELFYKRVNTATTRDISIITGNDEDAIVNRLYSNIVPILSSFNNGYSYIIISQLLYYYISKMSSFKFSNTNSIAFRCKQVGTIFNSTRVYVDYYIEHDNIICMANSQDFMNLYYNTTNIQENSLKYNLVISNYEIFKQNVVVLTDIKQFDPMEKNMLDSNVSDFF